MSFPRRAFSRFGYNKDVDVLLAEANAKGGLKKTLTARDLVTLGVAGIIGAGIFVLVGEGAATAGVGVIGAFVAAATICAVAGLAYAELASTIPASGSAYAYLYTAIGELPGWLVAWALILEYAVGAIAVAVGWRSNALALWEQFAGQKIFNEGAAYQWTHSPLESITLADGTVLNGILNLPSIAIVAACAGLLYFGTKESARVTSILVIVKVIILLLAIGVGFYLFEMANVTGEGMGGPWPTDDDGSALDFSGKIGAVLAAGAIMFFAYIGFDSVSTTAEETKNPKKDLPIGILGSLAITTFLYILAALALVGSAHWSTFAGENADPSAKEEPFGFVFEQAALGTTGGEAAFLEIAAAMVRVGALIGITSVLLVLILGGVRVFFNMSRDGLLPASISRVHPVRGNPAFTTALYGGFTLLFAGVLTLGKAVSLVNIGTLFAFLMVVIAAWAFRIRRPDVNRPFRMPMWSIWNTRDGKPILPLLPILGSAAILLLIFKLDNFTLFAFLAWTGIGLFVYGLYGIRNSKEAGVRHAPARRATTRK